MLSDPERRATYDRLGHAGLRRGGFEPSFAHFGNLSMSSPHSSARTSSVARVQSACGAGTRSADGRRDRPRGRALGNRGRRDRRGRRGCERCGATRAEPGTGARDCSTCGGLGVVRRVSRNVFGQFVQQRSCPECGGAGRVRRDTLQGLPRRASRRRRAPDRRRRACRDPRRPADSRPGCRSCRSDRRSRQRVRRRPRASRSAVPARRRRPAHRRTPHDDRGRARNDRPRRDAHR